MNSNVTTHADDSRRSPEAGHRVTTRRERRSWPRWQPLEPLVRWAIGALLLFAAFAKVHQGITNPTFDDRWWLIFQVQAEWFLGIWLISGLFVRLARTVTIGAFTVFLVVALIKVWVGDSSCGCFGIVQVHPWITVGIDLLAIVSLLITHSLTRDSQEQPRRPSMIRLTLTIGFFLLIALPGAGVWMIANAERIKLSDEGVVASTTSDGVVVVDPDGWEGKRLPLLPHIDIKDQIDLGKWMVVVIHHDCQRCRESVKELLTMRNTHADGNLAVIEAPPFAPVGSWPNTESATAPTASAIVQTNSGTTNTSLPYRLGRLSTEHDWFVETPLVITLESGLVRQVLTHEKRSLDALHLASRTAANNDSKESSEASEGGGVTRVHLGQGSTTIGATHPLGYLEAGAARRAAFVIQNDYDTSITLTRAQIECDCTQLNGVVMPLDIPSGGAIALPFIFTAPEVRSHYAKRIILHTDHPEMRTVPLTVSARIGLPLEVEPKVLVFEEATTGQMHEKMITVRNDGTAPVRILYATSTDPTCIAKVPRLTIEPGGSGQIPVIYSPDKTADPNDEIRLTLHTNLREQSTITARIRLSPDAAASR